MLDVCAVLLTGQETGCWEQSMRPIRPCLEQANVLMNSYYDAHRLVLLPPDGDFHNVLDANAQWYYLCGASSVSRQI